MIEILRIRTEGGMVPEHIATVDDAEQAVDLMYAHGCTYNGAREAVGGALTAGLRMSANAGDGFSLTAAVVE